MNGHTAEANQRFPLRNLITANEWESGPRSKIRHSGRRSRDRAIAPRRSRHFDFCLLRRKDGPCAVNHLRAVVSSNVQILTFKNSPENKAKLHRIIKPVSVRRDDYVTCYFSSPITKFRITSKWFDPYSSSLIVLVEKPILVYCLMVFNTRKDTKIFWRYH